MGCCTSKTVEKQHDEVKRSHESELDPGVKPCTASYVPETLGIVAHHPTADGPDAGDMVAKEGGQGVFAAGVERSVRQVASSQARPRESGCQQDVGGTAPVAHGDGQRARHEGRNDAIGSIHATTGPSADTRQWHDEKVLMPGNATFTTEPGKMAAQQKQPEAPDVAHDCAAIGDCSLTQSEARAPQPGRLRVEDEVWARLEQRMASPGNVGTGTSQQPTETEHVFVANYGSGHLQLEQQTSIAQEPCNSKPARRPVVGGCWEGAGDMAQAGDVMKTQFKHTDLYAQAESDEERTGQEDMNCQVESLDIDIDDL